MTDARRRWLPVVVLAALCGFLFFYGLTAANLFGVTCNIDDWSQEYFDQAQKLQGMMQIHVLLVLPLVSANARRGRRFRGPEGCATCGSGHSHQGRRPRRDNNWPEPQGLDKSPSSR